MTEGVGQDRAHPRDVRLCQPLGSLGRQELVHHFCRELAEGHHAKCWCDVDADDLGVVGACVVGFDTAVDHGFEPVLEPRGQGDLRALRVEPGTPFDVSLDTGQPRLGVGLGWQRVKLREALWRIGDQEASRCVGLLLTSTIVDLFIPISDDPEGALRRAICRGVDIAQPEPASLGAPARAHPWAVVVLPLRYLPAAPAGATPAGRG